MNTHGRTLIGTKEDHNIEDIHVTMVLKVQREKQILEMIEGNPGEQRNKASTIGNDEMNIDFCDGEEILGSDMCKEPAINWGKGSPLLPPIQLAMAQQLK